MDSLPEDFDVLDLAANIAYKAIVLEGFYWNLGASIENGVAVYYAGIRQRPISYTVVDAVSISSLSNAVCKAYGKINELMKKRCDERLTTAGGLCGN